MYRRFLNNDDYLGIVTEEALSQLTRDKDERLAQAEEAAESSILEYLSENYEVEEALAVGKNLLPYNRQITYPTGSHFYYDGKICKATRTINGYKAPMLCEYWSEYTDLVQDPNSIPLYTQRGTYVPGDIVRLGNAYFKCEEYNGMEYETIRIPGVNGWERIEAQEWVAGYEYHQWDAVMYDERFYALVTTDGLDLMENPLDSNCWGLIGSYDPAINSYELSEHEYVDMEGVLFVPVMNPNSDEVRFGYNIVEEDPRNSNLKKHILRLAVYELYKLISPNNVSQARITDYETSIMWLRDASRLKINPQIPRKLDKDNRPVADFAVASFQRNYDPSSNPWHI